MESDQEEFENLKLRALQDLKSVLNYDVKELDDFMRLSMKFYGVDVLKSEIQELEDYSRRWTSFTRLDLANYYAKHADSVTVDILSKRLGFSIFVVSPNKNVETGRYTFKNTAFIQQSGSCYQLLYPIYKGNYQHIVITRLMAKSIYLDPSEAKLKDSIELSAGSDALNN